LAGATTEQQAQYLTAEISAVAIHHTVSVTMTSKLITFATVTLFSSSQNQAKLFIPTKTNNRVIHLHSYKHYKLSSSNEKKVFDYNYYHITINDMNRSCTDLIKLLQEAL